mmetsp:Transcript_75927/g.180497  ORF Transcript_75927/g.180497 Transcript_75927/m.180497 type:complete len:1076 (-) Transcript_75927:92-3319(-)
MSGTLNHVDPQSNGNGMQSDMKALLLAQCDVKKEIQDMAEQMSKVQESLNWLCACVSPGRRSTRHSSFCESSPGERSAPGSPRSRFSEAHTTIADALMAVNREEKREREEGKLLKHARSLRVNKKARVGVAASALPVGWPVCVEQRAAFSNVMLRSDVELQLIAEACQHDHAQVPQLPTGTGVLVQTRGGRDALLDEAKEDPEKVTHRFILHPTSPPRLVVDIVSLFVLAYDLLVTPYVMAFDMQSEHEFVLGSLATLIFWTLSVPINLRSGFFKDGEVELRPGRIVRNYSRTWMMPDIFLVSTDWVSMGTLLIDTGSDGEGKGKYTAAFTLLRFSKVGRLLRLLGIFRMARFTVVLSRLADWCLSNTAKTMVESLGFVFALLWVNHLISCAWVAIGLNSSASDTGLSWLDASILPGSGMGSYKDSPEAYRYASSLHWAITQMSPGSMQVNPLNTNERFFTVVCLVLGILCSGSIVSTLTAKMMQIMMANQDRNKKLQVLRKFLWQKSISKPIAVQVQKMVLDRLAAGRPLTAQDVPALNLLSLALRASLQDELCRPHLSNHPFVRVVFQVDSGLCRDMCAQAVDFIVLPVEDNLFLSGSAASHTYLVVGGRLRYIQTPQSSMVQCTTETFAEKDSWISEAALWTHWTHVGTVEASTVTELMRINASEMVSILQKNQVVFLLAADYCRAFANKVTTAMPPVADWPNDLRVPFADYAHNVLMMSRECRTLIGLLALDCAKTSLQWRFTWAKIAEKLHQEVNNGSHAFINNGADAMERVVAFVSTRIEDDDERQLLQVAVWEDGATRIEASCKPIGTEVSEGEKLSDALRRVLLGPLSFFVKYLKIKCPEQEETKVDGDRHNVTTKCLSAIYDCSLEVYVEMPSFGSRDYQHKLSNSVTFTLDKTKMSSDAFFLLPGENQTSQLICAWIDKDSVDFWKSPAQRQLLQNLLGSVFSSKEDLEEARDMTGKVKEEVSSGCVSQDGENYSRFDDWVPAQLVLGLGAGASMNLGSVTEDIGMDAPVHRESDKEEAFTTKSCDSPDPDIGALDDGGGNAVDLDPEDSASSSSHFVGGYNIEI